MPPHIVPNAVDRSIPSTHSEWLKLNTAQQQANCRAVVLVVCCVSIHPQQQLLWCWLILKLFQYEIEYGESPCRHWHTISTTVLLRRLIICRRLRQAAVFLVLLLISFSAHTAFNKYQLPVLEHACRVIPVLLYARYQVLLRCMHAYFRPINLICTKVLTHLFLAQCYSLYIFSSYFSVVQPIRYSAVDTSQKNMLKQCAAICHQCTIALIKSNDQCKLIALLVQKR